MHTIRAAVLAVVLASTEPLPGRTIAQRAGVSHRQAADALGDLLDRELVARIGRKAHARWTRTQPTTDPTAELSRLLYGRS